MEKILLCLCLIFLTGCVNNPNKIYPSYAQQQAAYQAAHVKRAERQSEIKRLSFKEEMNKGKEECKERFDQDRRLDLIRDKIPAFFSDINIEHRSINSRVTKSERGGIVALDEVEKFCFEKQVAIMNKYMPPPLISLLHQAESGNRVRRADLLAGKITYGEYNIQTEAASNKFNSDAAQLFSEMQNKNEEMKMRQMQAESMRQQSIAAQKQAEAARLQAAAAQQQADDAFLQQMINLGPKPPQYTRCNRFGGEVSCVTQ